MDILISLSVMFMHATLIETFLTVFAGIQHGYMKNLKTMEMMLQLCEWIIRSAIYATEVDFMQKVINSAPVRCEVHST
jgi:hypothetical protein